MTGTNVVEMTAAATQDDGARTPRGWDHHYAALATYVANTGHARPPSAVVSDDGTRLGAWVTAQRHRYSTGRLAPERIKRLEQLPGWIWSAHCNDWAENYSALQRFAADTGHASPHWDHQTADGRRLGIWVQRQRKQYRQRRLSKERIERLEQLPGWTWSRQRAAWDENYCALASFVDAAGHARAPLSFVSAEGIRLGDWVRHQRARYRERRLCREQIERLEQLPGWSWRIDNPAEYDAAWELAFSALKGYVAAYGHAQPPFKGRGDGGGIRLGTWVFRQRRLYREGRLSPQRVHRLEALPEWTWVGRTGPHPKGSPLSSKSVAQQATPRPAPRR